MLSGVKSLEIPLTEMLIRMTIVVGIYVFIGNSGVVSFGHIGFTAIGAYAAAWASAEPTFKQLVLRGLPAILQHTQYSFLTAISGAAILPAVIALVVGAAIMRLSGIAASIATFAFLMIVNSVYSNWDSVTAGGSSLTGIPTNVGPGISLAFVVAVIFIAYFFQTSGSGLLLRASRDDRVAAEASGVRTSRVRLIAFVLSAAIAGVGGGLYAQFIGILTVDTFSLDMTFITIAMLVVGGVRSLSGAVIEVLAVTAVVQLLRFFEHGVFVAGTLLKLPLGSQEIGLGVTMALILIFRPNGLIRNNELPWVAFHRLGLPPSPARPVEPILNKNLPSRNPSPNAHEPRHDRKDASQSAIGEKQAL
jgi:branched-chain amino acid transport system permease protein